MTTETDNNGPTYEAVKAYFHRLKQGYVMHGSTSMLGELLARLCDIYDLTLPEACQVMTLMVTTRLYTRFSRPNFLAMSDVRRNAWLRSLLMCSPKGLELMTEMVETCFPNRLVEVDEAWVMAYTTKASVQEVERSMRSIRREKKHDAPKQRGRKTSDTSQPSTRATASTSAADPRQNHAMGSPHEWTNPKTMVRYYDDPAEGRVEIPYFAPPRPTAQAQWHLLRKLWLQDGTPIDQHGNYLIDDGR